MSGQAFVAGLLLDERGRVALVRKNRPDWQAGRLNAIGGKVEPGETSDQAMQREFREEAGLDLDSWDLFAHLIVPYGTVDFYRLHVEAGLLDQVRSMTDEQIEIHAAAQIPQPALANLSWLVPLATYTHDRYGVVVAREL